MQNDTAKMVRHFCIVILCSQFVSMASTLTITELASAIEANSKICERESALWVVVEDFACGSIKCDFPNQLCSLSTTPATMTCANVPAACKRLFVSEMIGITSIELASSNQTTLQSITTTPTSWDVVIVERKTSAPTITTTTSFAVDNCRDENILCCFWASLDECRKNPVYMKRVCRKTCGTCTCDTNNMDACKIDIQNKCGPLVH